MLAHKESGVGLFLACEDFGRMFDHSQSTVAQRTETTVAECSQRLACELVSGKAPTLCLDSGIASPLRLRLVNGVCVFRCNLPSALLAKWPGSSTYHCYNTGDEMDTD